MKEYKIGEKFIRKVNDKQTVIKCIEDTEEELCENCIFDTGGVCFYNCSTIERKDKKNVHFKEVE